MSQNEIEQIELSITEARKIVERGQMAENLAHNPTFAKLILQGYFVDEAARLAHLLSDPNSQAHQHLIHNDLVAIGGFKRYLQTLVQIGRAAANEIAQALDEIENIHNEEAAEE